MNTNRHILALIPARSGSRSVPGKNIQSYKGKPLLAYPILQAKQSRFITRTILSTDDKEYANIARSYGAETPFIRPMDISLDHSTDFETFEHTLSWLKENEDYVPELIVHLRATFPERNIKDIDECIQIMVDNPQYDSLRSVVALKEGETPFKMWFKDEKNILTPCVNSSINDAHSLPRQVLPKAYMQNAAIDVVRSRTITELKSMVGENIYGYMMQENLDIDTNGDLFANKLKSKTPMTLCFDFDGVLASIVPENDYSKATPIVENIAIVNRLYDAGHNVIINTARGFLTGKDWKAVTEKQIKDWGIQCHQLIQNQKPAADFYIDDRNLGIEDIKINLQ